MKHSIVGSMFNPLASCKSVMTWKCEFCHLWVVEYELLQGGASEARLAHNEKVVGSIPTPASKLNGGFAHC